MGQRYLPAVRADKEELVVTHVDNPPGERFQDARVAKEGRPCINVLAAGLSTYRRPDQSEDPASGLERQHPDCVARGAPALVLPLKRLI